MTKKKETKQTEQVIEIPALDIKLMELKLEGDSPLICHAWSNKAKELMLNRQMKKAQQAKKAKDPEQDFEESLYPYPGGGYGFPAVAFKAAAINGCSFVDGVTKVLARGAFHVVGELVKIEGSKPTPREDMVRIGMGVADIRYRGQFKKWSVKLQIRFNSNVLSVGQISNLFNIAGFAIGVGEWRPQKGGSYGMFHVA